MRSETKPSQDEEKNGQEPLLPPIQPGIDFGSGGIHERDAIAKAAARPSTA